MMRETDRGQSMRTTTLWKPSWGKLACAVSCAILLTGCASSRPPAPAWNQPAVELRWPLPPEPPRIAYVGALTTGDDLNRRSGLLQGFVSLLTGHEPRGMVKPIAVAKNKDQLLVVADPAIPTVHFFDLARSRYSRLSRKLSSQLLSPVAVAVGDDGLVYVSDSVYAKVFVFDGPKRLVRTIGETVLQRPTGLALSPDGDRLYVVDTLSAQVVAFDRNGREVGRMGSRGTRTGSLNFPTYVAVAEDGRIFVSDSLNFRVQVFSPDGRHLMSFGGPGNSAGSFTRPKGVSVDRFGHCFVVDAAFENVQIFDGEGRLLMAFGSSGGGPGQFTLPSGIWVDRRDDTVWVADSYNQRVEAFRLVVDKR